MKASEIKELTVKEIVEKIENESSFLVKQKLNHAISPLDNPLKMKEISDFVEPFRELWEERFNKLENIMKNYKPKP